MECFLTAEQAENISFIRTILPETFRNGSIKTCHNKNTFNSFAYCLNDEYIIRFPKLEKAKQKLIKENKVLNFLVNKTSLQIPQTSLIQQDYFCTVHKKIHGENITQTELSNLTSRQYDKFCSDIALFMFQLHSLTDEISKNISLNFWDRFERLAPAETIKDYLLSVAEFSKAEQDFIENFLNLFHLEDNNPVIKFGHFDVMSKNLAFDGSTQSLAGIYDFGDCGVGNILHDFSQIALDFNIKTVGNIVRYYRKLNNTDLNIQRINEYSLYSRLAFAYRYQGGYNSLPLLKDKITEMMFF